MATQVNIDTARTLNNVSTAPGADMLAAFQFLGENGRSVTSGVNPVVNDIIGYGMVQIHSRCDSALIVDQDIDVTCNDPVKGNLVRNGKNCELCRQGVRDLMKERAEIEQLAKNANPEYKEQTANSTVVERLEGNDPSADLVDYDSVCRYVCFQCVIDNFEQIISVQLATKCQDFQNFRSSFVTDAFERARYHVTQNKEALESMGYRLQSDAALDQFSLNMVTTIRNMTTLDTYNLMFNQALLVQQTVIEDSTSVVISNAKQSITNSQMASIASKVYNQTDFLNAIGYTDKKAKFEDQVKFQNIVKATKEGAGGVKESLSTATGKILLSVVMLLAAGLLIYGIVWYRRRVRQQQQNEQENYDGG